MRVEKKNKLLTDGDKLGKKLYLCTRLTNCKLRGARLLAG